MESLFGSLDSLQQHMLGVGGPSLNNLAQVFELSHTGKGLTIHKNTAKTIYAHNFGFGSVNLKVMVFTELLESINHTLHLHSRPCKQHHIIGK